MKKITTILINVFLLGLSHGVLAQAVGDGKNLFDTTCARCHGGDANGGENGPAILARIEALDNSDLAATIRAGSPARGMPAFAFNDSVIEPLVDHLRVLAFASSANDIKVIQEFTLVNNQILKGEVLNSGLSDLQLRDEQGGINLLRRSQNDRWRLVTSQQDWPSYHGDASGNRFSLLTGINKSNVEQLAPAWIFPMSGASQIQNTPLVVEGVMYISSANEVYALDAGSGRQIWHYRRPRTAGLPGPASAGINRGVAIADNKVFLQTDNAHLIALDSANGDLLWETEMADSQENYQGTGAPLVAGSLVISGIGGGDFGARGFVAAYDISTGLEVWRRWTIPKAGEPGSETWQGDALIHGAGGTWMTGTFDEELDLLYWPVGNPGPDFDGDERIGDNLWTDSILALDAKTGEMAWYFQFTPHDIHDWDAQEPPVLIDTQWRGEQRKLLIQANRNGFFYVMDRTDGELLLANAFIDKLNWASGLDENGRPILNELMVNESGESYVCPGLYGGTNWYSTAYNASTGLYYVQVLEQCNFYSVNKSEWESGKDYMSGTTRQVPGEIPEKFIRGINIQTGEVDLEIAQAPVTATVSAGLIGTAANLIFYGDAGGEFVAADAETGEILWQFPTNHIWKASPMTYEFDNEQYIAVAIGLTITAFKVP